MDDLMMTGTALTAPAPTDLQALFQRPDGIKAELARIKAKAIEAAKGLDVSRKKDRETLVSVAFAVTKRKTALDKAGKELNAERRRLNEEVDKERRMIDADLDRFANDLRAPVTAWEAADAARIAAIEARLATSFKLRDLPSGSDDLTAIRGTVAAVPLDQTWAEYLDQARAAQVAMLDVLDRATDAELARLRKEMAERDEADRLERELEATEAAERQRVADDAASAARAAQEAAEAARIRAEREADDLRRQLVEAQDKAARDAREAETRAAQAKRDEEAAAERARQEAEVAAIERARKADAEKRAIAEAAASQAQDAEYRARIHADIVADITALPSLTAAAIADALMLGAVRHVQVVM